MSQASGVAFAAHIASNATQLPTSARKSIIGALSSVVEAGFFRSKTQRRLSSSSDASAASEVAAVLQAVHRLTLKDLAPGEEPTETQAGALALSSSKTSCSLGSCTAIEGRAPSLFDGRNSNASIVLSSPTLVDIVETSELSESCASSLGLSVVSWGESPYPVPGHDSESSNMTLSGNVTSFTVTSCGEEVDVANLSVPVVITLPITPLEPVGAVHTFVAHCDGDTDEVTVPCVDVGGGDETLVLDCRRGGAYNATCPSVSSTAVCAFWDERQSTWSTENCVAQPSGRGASSTSVRCECNHLSSYTGATEEACK